MIAPEEPLPSDPVAADAAAAADDPRPSSRGSEDFYLPPHVVAAANSSAPSQNLALPADGLTVTSASSSIVALSDCSPNVSAATAADNSSSTATSKSLQVNAMDEIVQSSPAPPAASATSAHDSPLVSRVAMPAPASAPELDDEPPCQAAPLIIDTVSSGPASPPPKSTPSPSPNSRSRGLVPPLAASSQMLTSLLEQHREIDSTSSFPSSTLPSSPSVLQSNHRRNESAAHTADRSQQQLRRGRLRGLHDEHSAALGGAGASNGLLLPATDRSAENDSDQDDSDDDLSSIVTSTTCTASRAPTARSTVDSDVGVFDHHHRHHHQNLHSLSPPSSMLRSSNANAPPSLQAAARFLAAVDNGSGAAGTDAGDDATAGRRAGHQIFDFGRPPASLAPGRGSANGMQSPSASATAASAHQGGTQAPAMAAHATALRTAESVKREITELHRQWHDEDCEAAEEEPYYFQSDSGLHRRPHPNQHQHQGAHDGGAGSLDEYHAIQLDLQSALRQVHMMRLDQRLLHARLDEMEALRNAALGHVRELVAAIPALSSSSSSTSSAGAGASVAGSASSSSAAAAAVAMAAAAGLRNSGASSKAPFSASPNGASVSAAALRRRLESESTVLSKSIAATRARLRAVDADRVRARQAVGALEAERAKLLIGCRRAEEGERARKEAQRTAHRLAEALRECKQQLDVANTDRNLLRQEMHDLALLLSTDRSAFASSSAGIGADSASASPPHSHGHQHHPHPHPQHPHSHSHGISSLPLGLGGGSGGPGGATITSLPATYVNELSSALLTTPDKWVPVTGVIARHLQRVGGSASGAVSATPASASGAIHAASAAVSPAHSNHQAVGSSQKLASPLPLSPASTSTSSSTSNSSPQLQIARAYFDTLAASAAASASAASLAAGSGSGSISAQTVSPTAVSALGAKLARLQHDRLQQIRALQQLRRRSEGGNLYSEHHAIDHADDLAASVSAPTSPQLANSSVRTSSSSSSRQVQSRSSPNDSSTRSLRYAVDSALIADERHASPSAKTEASPTAHASGPKVAHMQKHLERLASARQRDRTRSGSGASKANGGWGAPSTGKSGNANGKRASSASLSSGGERFSTSPARSSATPRMDAESPAGPPQPQQHQHSQSSLLVSPVPLSSRARVHLSAPIALAAASLALAALQKSDQLHSSHQHAAVINAVDGSTPGGMREAGEGADAGDGCRDDSRSQVELNQLIARITSMQTALQKPSPSPSPLSPLSHRTPIAGAAAASVSPHAVSPAQASPHSAPAPFALSTGGAWSAVGGYVVDDDGVDEVVVIED